MELFSDAGSIPAASTIFEKRNLLLRRLRFLVLRPRVGFRQYRQGLVDRGYGDGDIQRCWGSTS